MSVLLWQLFFVKAGLIQMNKEFIFSLLTSNVCIRIVCIVVVYILVVFKDFSPIAKTPGAHSFVPLRMQDF